MLKKYNQIKGLICVLIGILFIIIPHEFIINLFKYILGLGLLIVFLPSALIGLSSNNHSSTAMYLTIRSLIFACLGIVILICGFNIIGTIVGSIIMVFLLIDLFSSTNKKERFNKDILKYVLAIILIVVGIGTLLDILLYIIGAIFIIIGLLLIFINPSVTPKTTSKNTSIPEDVIDAKFTEEKDGK